MSFPNNEPVLAVSGAGAVVSYALSALVTHGVITDTAASTLSQQLVPLVAGLFTLGLGFVARHYVTPTSQIPDVAAGLLTDADYGRLQALIADASLPPNTTVTLSSPGREVWVKPAEPDVPAADAATPEPPADPING